MQSYRIFEISDFLTGKEGLEKIQAQRKEKNNISLQDIQLPQFGVEVASKFFNNLFNM